MKNPVNWKPIRSINRSGNPFANRFPDLLDTINRGTLLGKIIAMKPQEPLSFEQAANMAFAKWSEALGAHRIGYGWPVPLVLQSLCRMDFSTLRLG
ncbi:MAG: hypothetical protein C5B49_09260 [Bdellovibrio sp.]|nr:MAG: hypothetical protein C5B49_09260 [Bdellovibrio sp.]